VGVEGGHLRLRLRELLVEVLRADAEWACRLVSFRGDLDERGEHLDEGLLPGLVEALQGAVDPVGYFFVASD
jgi:hypothetical protein